MAPWHVQTRFVTHAVFFWIGKDKLDRPMQGDMDRFCTIVIVVGAVILVFMGYSEMNRMNVQRQASGMCGRAAKLTTGNEPKSAKAASAKRSFAPKSADKVLDQTGEFLSLSDTWPNETNSDCAYKPLPQDAKALGVDFTWEAPTEVDQNFDHLKHFADPDKWKQHAGTRSIRSDTVHEEPTYSKTRGLTNPLSLLYHGCGKREEVKFGQACTWFGGTDQYYNARQKTAKCDCLREDCDTCAK